LKNWFGKSQKCIFITHARFTASLLVGIIISHIYKNLYSQFDYFTIQLSYMIVSIMGYKKSRTYTGPAYLRILKVSWL